MTDPRQAFQAVRQSLEGVVQALRATPGAPADYVQAADWLSEAIAGLDSLPPPVGPDYGPAAARIEGLIHQAYVMLEPRFSSHPSWAPLQRALQTAFDTLTGASRAAKQRQADTATAGSGPAMQVTGPLSDPKQWAVALLVLRHLYDGDVIEWPIAEDHPKRALFEELERLGLIARWDRIWPLTDRYRLTEHGIQEIERHYRPADAEAIQQQLRASGATEPKDRQRWLRERGLDPWTWSVVHDPYVHWSNWESDPGSTFRYVWGSRPGRGTGLRNEPHQPTVDVPLDEREVLPASPHERPLGDYS